MHLALPKNNLDGGAHMWTGRIDAPDLLVFTTYSVRMFCLVVKEDGRCH